MGDWLRHIALSAKARTGFGPALMVWFAIVLVSLVLALGFFCAAAFVWLASRYDGVTAGLILGGGFLLLAVLAAVAGWITRLRNIEQARLELAARSQAGWLDPEIPGGRAGDRPHARLAPARDPGGGRGPGGRARQGMVRRGRQGPEGAKSSRDRDGD